MKLARLFLSLLLLLAVNPAQAFFHGGAGSGGGGGPTVFTPLHTYYMAATGCNDSNSGTSAGSPWCKPGHNTVCGDVILMAPGTYQGFAGSQPTVSNCPSTSGGIDGTGGIYSTVVMCAVADLGTSGCIVNDTLSTGDTTAFDINTSNVTYEGIQCNGNGTNRCFQSTGCTVLNHHLAFINDIAVNTAQGYGMNDCGNTGGQNTISIDYWAVVGSIAQNAASDPICLAAIDAVGPGQLDANAGTHLLMYGNFSYANANTSCRSVSDTEDYMFDTLDRHDVNYQAVMANNIGYDADRMCAQTYEQNNYADTPTVLIHHNTCFQNLTNTGTDNADGEINIQVLSGTTATWTINVHDNLVYEPLTTTGGGGSAPAKYALVVSGTNAGLTVGGSGTQNFLKASNTSCISTCNTGDDAVSFGTLGELGTNTYTNPAYINTTDLLANHIGTPNCTGFATTTACMGWNANTSTLTTLTVISDLVATASGTSGKGYVLPSTTCASNAEYPTWLKGVVALRDVAGVIYEEPDLVTKPCGL